MGQDTDRWKKLEVWQVADGFARGVYRTTGGFPREELYGMTSQLRRAALSVPTNIVEGYSRRGDRELARFLDIALGSLAESKYLLHFSKSLGYLSEEEDGALSGHADRVGQMLWKFYDRIRKR